MYKFTVLPPEPQPSLDVAAEMIFIYFCMPRLLWHSNWVKHKSVYMHAIFLIHLCIYQFVNMGFVHLVKNKHMRMTDGWLCVLFAVVYLWCLQTALPNTLLTENALLISPQPAYTPVISLSLTPFLFWIYITCVKKTLPLILYRKAARPCDAI